MSQSNRGAAQVSLMWVIAFAVIMLMCLGFAFLQNSANTDLQNKADEAKLATETAEAALADLRQLRAAEFLKIGFTSDGGDSISMEAMDAARNEYISRLGLDGGNINAFADLASPVFAKVAELEGQRDALQAEVNQLRNDLDARNSASQTAMRDKDATISDLRKQMEDQANAKDGQIVDIERTRDALRDQLRDRDREITSLNALLDQQSRDSATELAVLKQRNDILTGRLNSVARRADTADGSVLAVSGELGRAWIDRGYQDRVTVGMVFEVRNANTQAVKGKLKVTAVEAGRAQAKILEQVDQYDPVRVDDVILNAVYDPNRQLVAALVGNGFGTYNANDMTAMLEKIGVEVREGVSSETDFLLLGTPFFDEETGEMLPWENQDGHKAASSLSVSIIPMRDWSQWLGL